MAWFVVVFVIFSVSLCLGSDISTVSPNSITSPGYSRNTTKDGLTKRGIKVEDITGKSYDPPPEYYRGPALSSGSSSYNSNRDNTVPGYVSRPVAFPDENYGYKGGSSGASWSNNGGAAGTGQQERKGHHDRVSVGHYGTSGGSSQSGYGGGSHGYGSSTTPHPYGPPQAIEYEYYAPTGNSHGYADGGEAIPVELYNRGYGGYGHAGEYTTYTVASGGHESGAGHGGAGYGGGHQSGKHGYDKALLAKSFLIPLASAAVLGIAAALASNPLLLQLGTVSSIGKRRKRALEKKLAPAMALAYRGQRWN